MRAFSRASSRTVSSRWSRSAPTTLRRTTPIPRCWRMRCAGRSARRRRVSVRLPAWPRWWLCSIAGRWPRRCSNSCRRGSLPPPTIWRPGLALGEPGSPRSDRRGALGQLDERLAKLSAAAESAPQLVHEAVADVRQSVIELLQRVDSSAASILETLRTERAALSVDVRTEREAVVMAADVERKAIARDAARIAEQVVRSSGEQARHLAREVLLLLIVLAVVVLGLPFAAGYLVGRARGGRVPAQGR